MSPGPGVQNLKTSNLFLTYRNWEKKHAQQNIILIPFVFVSGIACRFVKTHLERNVDVSSINSWLTDKDKWKTRIEFQPHVCVKHSQREKKQKTEENKIKAEAEGNWQGSNKKSETLVILTFSPHTKSRLLFVPVLPSHFWMSV